MPSVDPIVAALKARRVELGLTQAAVGHRMHVAANRISHLESGHNSPSLATVRLWAAVLGYDIAAAPRAQLVDEHEDTAAREDHPPGHRAPAPPPREAP